MVMKIPKPTWLSPGGKIMTSTSALTATMTARSARWNWNRLCGMPIALVLNPVVSCHNHPG